jgi:hypothetical protein
MKPAGSERNMAANIDALRQNASQGRGKPMGRWALGPGGTDAHLRGYADGRPARRCARGGHVARQWLAKG